MFYLKLLLILCISFYNVNAFNNCTFSPSSIKGYSANNLITIKCNDYILPNLDNKVLINFDGIKEFTLLDPSKVNLGNFNQLDILLPENIQKTSSNVSIILQPSNTIIYLNTLLQIEIDNEAPLLNQASVISVSNDDLNSMGSIVTYKLDISDLKSGLKSVEIFFSGSKYQFSSSYSVAVQQLKSTSVYIPIFFIQNRDATYSVTIQLTDIAGNFKNYTSFDNNTISFKPVDKYDSQSPSVQLVGSQLVYLDQSNHTSPLIQLKFSVSDDISGVYQLDLFNNGNMVCQLVKDEYSVAPVLNQLVECYFFVDPLSRPSFSYEAVDNALNRSPKVSVNVGDLLPLKNFLNSTFNVSADSIGVFNYSPQSIKTNSTIVNMRVNFKFTSSLGISQVQIKTPQPNVLLVTLNSSDIVQGNIYDGTIYKRFSVDLSPFSSFKIPVIQTNLLINIIDQGGNEKLHSNSAWTFGIDHKVPVPSSKLSNFSFSPETVDLTDRERIITFQWNFESVAPIAQFKVTIGHMSYLIDSSEFSGTGWNGKVSKEIVFPKLYQQGIYEWKIESTNSLGQVVQYDVDSLPKLNIQSPSATEYKPIILSTFKFLRSPTMENSKDQIINFLFTLENFVIVPGKTIQSFTVSNEYQYGNVWTCNDFQMISGTELSGVYGCTINVQRQSPAKKYIFQKLYLKNHHGVELDLDWKDFKSMKLDHYFEVTNGQSVGGEPDSVQVLSISHSFETTNLNWNILTIKSNIQNSNSSQVVNGLVTVSYGSFFKQCQLFTQYECKQFETSCSVAVPKSYSNVILGASVLLTNSKNQKVHKIYQNPILVPNTSLPFDITNHRPVKSFEALSSSIDVTMSNKVAQFKIQVQEFIKEYDLNVNGTMMVIKTTSPNYKNGDTVGFTIPRYCLTNFEISLTLYSSMTPDPIVYSSYDLYSMGMGNTDQGVYVRSITSKPDITPPQIKSFKFPMNFDFFPSNKKPKSLDFEAVIIDDLSGVDSVTFHLVLSDERTLECNAKNMVFDHQTWKCSIEIHAYMESGEKPIYITTKDKTANSIRYGMQELSTILNVHSYIMITGSQYDVLPPVPTSFKSFTMVSPTHSTYLSVWKFSDNSGVINIENAYCKLGPYTCKMDKDSQCSITIYTASPNKNETCLSEWSVYGVTDINNNERSLSNLDLPMFNIVSQNPGNNSIEPHESSSMSSQSTSSSTLFILLLIFTSYTIFL
ncbi:hypothetical protein DLAC_10726 [Tieghemostelium lacteum]|uniref:Uncharacterized protein n=1 Tax=Tieghemostelium lacteum TaxID=361077 RepID=A0A151Z418_TIELA|nr:hypothetical protein DLAC_10726 [Tieghemostelium lacteum]|eukprot:KYQ88706.1 hypothetical protein DLAC_10726 [Tieghemostelium lacteum]